MPGNWDPNCTTTTCERLFEDVSGSSATNVYAVSYQGTIERYGGSGAWAQVANTGKRLHGVYVSPTGNVFAAGLNTLVHCLNNCATSTDFTVFTNTGNSIEWFGMCGRGNDVYAVGGATIGNGTIWKFNASNQTWGAYVSDTGISQDHMACWVAPDGQVFVTSYGNMLRVNTTPLAFVENITPPTNPADVQILWQDVWGAANGDVFAIGRYRRIIKRASGSSTWTMVYSTNDPNGYVGQAIEGGAPDEAYATGIYSGGNGINLARWNGTTWSAIGDGQYYIDVYGIYAPNPNTYFFVGQKGNSYAGMIVLGSR